MTQQARKMARNHTSAKPDAGETLQMVSDAKEKAISMGHDGIEEMLREADYFNRVAREYAGACSGALCAGVESGNATSKALREVSQQWMKSVDRAFSDNAAFFKEVLACRNLNDLSKWRENAWQKAMDRYFNEANALMEVWFDGCGKAFDPLQEHSVNASHQLRKAMAA